MIKLLQKTVFNTFVFKIAFLIFAFAYVFPFTINFSEINAKIFLLWGLLLILYYLSTNKDYLISKNNLIMYIFLFLIFLSVLFNPNKINDFKSFLYLIIQIMIPFIFNKNKNNRILHFELCIINYIVITLSFLISIASLVIYIINFRSSIIVNNAEYLFGMQEGRLYGILGNPNSGSLVAYISIIISFLVLTQNAKLDKNLKKALLNYYIIFNILIQSIILFLGNSRSTLIIFSLSLSIIFFYKFFNRKNINIIKNILMYLIIFVMMFISIFFISKISNKIVSYFPGIYTYITALKTEELLKDDKIDNLTNTLEIIKQDSIENDRIYNTTDNSNGRLGIWKIGFKVIKNNFIFGVGSENIKNEAIRNAPEYFNQGILGNMHNIYIQIMVGSGIFALISFILLLSQYLLTILRAIIYKKSSQSVIVIFSLIIGLCIENLFDSNMVYFMFMAVVPVFWIYLAYGYQLSLEGDNCNEKNIISD
jgi:O-Antigen ligase.